MSVSVNRGPYCGACVGGAVSDLSMFDLQHIHKLSYGDQSAGNALILGDNADVLERIGDDLRGLVRCVYIDPPYNNNERYTHYDDRLGHREWLEQLGDVLALLERLLRDDGSLWISIDDNEVHYLKVLADEIFGRSRFVTTVVWEHRTSRENRKVFSNNHEYLLVYAKDPDRFRATRNPVARPRKSSRATRIPTMTRVVLGRRSRRMSKLVMLRGASSMSWFRTNGGDIGLRRVGAGSTRRSAWSRRLATGISGSAAMATECLD